VDRKPSGSTPAGRARAAPLPVPPPTLPVGRARLEIRQVGACTVRLPIAVQELCPVRTILAVGMLKVLLAQAIHDVPLTTVVPAAAVQAVPCFPAVLARWAIARSPAGTTLPVVWRAPRVVPALRVVLAPAVVAASSAIPTSAAGMTLPVVRALPVVPALRVVGAPLEVGALAVAVQAPRVGRAKGVVPPSMSGNRRPWIS